MEVASTNGIVLRKKLPRAGAFPEDGPRNKRHRLDPVQSSNRVGRSRRITSVDQSFYHCLCFFDECIRGSWYDGLAMRKLRCALFCHKDGGLLLCGDGSIPRCDGNLSSSGSSLPSDCQANECPWTFASGRTYGSPLSNDATQARRQASAELMREHTSIDHWAFAVTERCASYRDNLVYKVIELIIKYKRAKDRELHLCMNRYLRSITL